MSEKKIDVWSEITADANAFKNVTTDGGQELSQLVKSASDLIKDIKDKEDDLKLLKSKKQRYEYELIPAKMAEMGIDKLTVDGNTVSLTTFVQATMPKDPMDKERAIGHLRDIGAEDFIKNQVQISFGINEDNSARSLQSELEDKGHDTTARTWVEPSTLKKLVRERVEANQPIDLELFKAYVGQTAKIKGEK
jgi:hypothetical protein|tara:strand:- start:164 stop:742 length:579 start_codon:yes stop_codon:yes gene_type:complete